jgi:penicillin-binding protein 2
LNEWLPPITKFQRLATMQDRRGIKGSRLCHRTATEMEWGSRIGRIGRIRLQLAWTGLLFCLLIGGGLGVLNASAGTPSKAPNVQKKTTRSSRQEVTSKTKKSPSSKIASRSSNIKRPRGEVVSRKTRVVPRRPPRQNVVRLRALHAREETLRTLAASNISLDHDLGEDPFVRQSAIDALDGRAGTVVVLDPNNGRVLTVVNQQMAVGYPVKPCSTVKLVVGLAALHEQVFDPSEDVRLSKRQTMSISEAMARSNNPLFQVLGRLLGFDRVLFYARNFGFGEMTGINYPGEVAGYLPRAEGGASSTGHMSSHGDNFGVTAIQLAAFTAAIANGGTLYVPQVIRSAEELATFQPMIKRRIEMTMEDRAQLLDGMAGAVTYGTGRLAYSPLRQIVGKTGTCTGDERDKLGLFTSFTSAEQPSLVVTVITNGYQEAGRRAAEVAGRLYAAILPHFMDDSMREAAANPRPALNEPSTRLQR